MTATFDRAMAWLAWACRPALVFFPLLALAEMAGFVSMEVVIPFAVMAAVHAAGRKYGLALRAREFRFGPVRRPGFRPVGVAARANGPR